MNKKTISVMMFVILAIGNVSVGYANEKINFVNAGGSYGEVLDKAYSTPFEEETNIDVNHLSTENYLDGIRARHESGDGGWDVVEGFGHEAIKGCDQGYLEKIDFIDEDRLLENSLTECGVAYLTYGTALVYHEDSPIQNWEDFFDPSIEAKRGFRKKPVNMLEFALMADGVPPDRVYQVLSTDEGVDRALGIVDRIKEHIVWWEFGAQANQLLLDREVAATPTFTGRVVNDDFDNFVIHWNSQIRTRSWLMVPKAGETEKAKKFVSFVMSDQINKNVADYMPYGPTTKVSVEQGHIDDSFPTHPDNMKKYLDNDPRFWADHQDRIEQKFFNWLNSK